MPYHIEDKIGFLSEASKVLSSSLDYNVILASVGKLIVDNVADFCIIDIIDEGQIKRVTVKASTTRQQKIANRFFKFPADPKNKNAIYDAARKGRPIIIKEVNKTWLSKVSRIKEEVKTVKDLKLKSLIFAPMITRNRVIGVLTIGSSLKNFSYNEEDAVFIEELVSRSGLAVDNARLFSRAVEALQTRDEFLSIASHELRTPLTSLLLNLQMTLRRIRNSKNLKPEQIERMVEQSEQQGKRLSKLINDLLNVSVMSTGRLEIEKEEVDLIPMIKDVLQRFEIQLKKIKVKVLLRYKRNIKGFWDKIRIEQVITNVISNAIKYGNKKPISIEVTKSKGMAVIKIKDKGIGVKGDEIYRIFDRFKRTSTAKGYRGLGVGLYISKQIVDAHGGNIAIESKEGKGSTFIIRLPVDKKA